MGSSLVATHLPSCHEHEDVLCAERGGQSLASGRSRWCSGPCAPIVMTSLPANLAILAPLAFGRIRSEEIDCRNLNDLLWAICTGHHFAIDDNCFTDASHVWVLRLLWLVRETRAGSFFYAHPIANPRAAQHSAENTARLNLKFPAVFSSRNIAAGEDENLYYIMHLPLRRCLVRQSLRVGWTDSLRVGPSTR